MLLPFFSFDQEHGKASASLFFIIASVFILSLPLGWLIGVLGDFESTKITLPLINLKFWAGPIYLTWLSIVGLLATLIYFRIVKSDLKNLMLKYRQSTASNKARLMIIFLVVDLPIMLLLATAFLAGVFAIGYLGHLVANLFS